MRNAFTLFSGIFLVMALSNAIVPVLPAYSSSSSMQGAIYAAYFLGAFLSTLPAGMLSDRFGRIPLVRSGLVITVASGIFLIVSSAPYLVLAARALEGVGGGCFVAAAMSSVNTCPDHERMSGYFMAFLNAGLVTGLVLAGWLALHSGIPAAGILLFTLIALVPACTSFFMAADAGHLSAPFLPARILALVRDYRWLWFSSVILVGTTGVVSSLYPQYSGATPESLGYWIAVMSVATIGAVLAASRASLPPLRAIRWSAAVMAVGVLFAFFSPWGFAVLGLMAGIVMIAQMAFLAGVKEYQGALMGLFSTTSYLGMAILPFIAGIVADISGFFWAFCIAAFLAVLVFLTIGRSPAAEKAWITPCPEKQ